MPHSSKTENRARACKTCRNYGVIKMVVPSPSEWANMGIAIMIQATFFAYPL